MASISKIIGLLPKVQGCATRVTLTGKQALELATKDGAKIPRELVDIVGKYPKAKITMAGKASENGFVIGAFNVKNGKDIVANGAASITGLGTKEAVVKTRLNAGNNGSLLNLSGYYDLAHTPKIEDLETAMAYQKGVFSASSKMGQFMSGHLRADIPQIAEATGHKVNVTDFKNTINKMYKNMTNDVRNVLAGKEPKSKIKAKKLYENEFVKYHPEDFAKLKESILKDPSFVKNFKKTKSPMDELKELTKELSNKFDKLV